MNYTLSSRLLSTGKTGEPRSQHYWALGRRTRSTRGLEREPVMVKRNRGYAAVAAGKGSKRTHHHGGVPYVNSLTPLQRSPDGLKTAQRLQTLWQLSLRPYAKVYDLWKLMECAELWIAAYKKLAANGGSMTPGGAKGTLDGTSLRGLNTLKALVISGRVCVGVTQRVTLPRPGGSLGCPKFRDRLIQEVMGTLLECVYEPRFLGNSHGSRPRRSQHTCLRQVRRDFGSASWMITGLVEYVDHSVVMNCIRRTVDDAKFCRLLQGGLRCRNLNPRGKINGSTIGAHGGGDWRPLLSNIVLHQLDRYVARLKRRVDRGARRGRNPAYVSAINAVTYGARSGSMSPRDVGKLRSRARVIGSTLRDDPDYRRLVYVRYDDDFLVGITGPRSLAQRIKIVLSDFLRRRLRLTLNPPEMLISHVKTQPTRYLGYRIVRGPKYVMAHRRHDGRVTRAICRHHPGGLQLHVDMTKVLAGLAFKGYCTSRGEPMPNFRYYHQTQIHTVTNANKLISNLSNYYKLSEGRRSCMNWVSYILRFSLAKTFAAKYKLRSSTKVFRVAGKDLSMVIGKADGVGPGPGGRAPEASARRSIGTGVLYTRYHTIPKPDLAPLAKNWRSWAGNERALPNPISRWTGFSNPPCAMCGSRDHVDMHPARTLRSNKGKIPVEIAMTAARQKQIPLCRVCHRSAHGQSSHR